MPLSIDDWSAPIAVITEITENTPMVMPTIVSPERNLFAPNDCSAMARISRNSMVLLVSQRRDRIQARRRPGGRETGNEAGENRNDHADQHESERKFDRERGKRLRDPKTNGVGKRQSDQTAHNTKSSRFDEELEQDRAPPRPKRFACSNFFRSFLYAHKRDVHDPNRADEKGKAGDKKTGDRDRILHRIERALERLLLVDVEVVLLFRRQRTDPPHQTGKFAFRLFQPRLVAHLDAHIGLGFGAEEFLKRRQRHDDDRVQAKETEKRTLPRADAENAELLPADLHFFSDRAFSREKRIRDVVAKETNVRGALHLELIEEATLIEIDHGNQRIFGGRSLNEDASDLVVAALNILDDVRGRHGQNEIRVWRRRDHAVQRFRVFGFDFATVAIVPPVVHAGPRILADVEDIVAKDGHAFVEARLDTSDRGAHQGHGHDADNHTQRGQHRAGLVRLHLRERDLPAFVQLVNQPFHVTASLSISGCCSLLASLSIKPSRRKTVRRACRAMSDSCVTRMMVLPF